LQAVMGKLNAAATASLAQMILCVIRHPYLARI
jgi:hypothetical protein